MSLHDIAAHYEITGDEKVLESAINKTKYGIFTGQLENGGWAGHNSWIVYQGIILRGIVELYRVLPTDHPFRKELYPHIIAAMNHIIVQQTESGAVWNCWDLDELSR